MWGLDEFHDEDMDGLPDWWESYHYESPIGALPGDNADSDDRDNLSEYKQGYESVLSSGYFTMFLLMAMIRGDGLSSEPLGDNQGPKATNTSRDRRC